MNIRTQKALAKQGLRLEQHFSGISYLLTAPNGVQAELLHAEGVTLDAKAVQQLREHMGLGADVKRLCTTPDFHAGSGEVGPPVGMVMATAADLVFPHAIGTDINCGMRLHTTDLTLPVLMEHKGRIVSLLKGDLLLGTRDLPLTEDSFLEVFRTGVIGLLSSLTHRKGQLAASDMGQLFQEVGRIYEDGSLNGDEKYSGFDFNGSSERRDPGLGTVGQGNHFVEFQVVDEIFDRQTAFRWGLHEGSVCYMIHTGSRSVGLYVGRRWADKARGLWPKGVKYPTVFPVRGDAVPQYLTAMNTAANYAFVNRFLLGEIIRLRMREVFPNLEAPLMYDLPHNLVFQEGGQNIHRKGAAPAHYDQPVLIPGSMGHPSYVLRGLGETTDGGVRFLSSASHGAGRASSRGEMHHVQDLGLDGVECFTLRESRKVEEAPAAYRDIGPVVDVQIRAGTVAPVVKLRPLFTFKA